MTEVAWVTVVVVETVVNTFLAAAATAATEAALDLVTGPLDILTG